MNRLLLIGSILLVFTSTALAQQSRSQSAGNGNHAVQPLPAGSSEVIYENGGGYQYNGSVGNGDCNCNGGGGTMFSTGGEAFSGSVSAGCGCGESVWTCDPCACDPCFGRGRGFRSFGGRPFFGGRWSRNAGCCF